MRHNSDECFVFAELLLFDELNRKLKIRIQFIESLFQTLFFSTEFTTYYVEF